MTKPHLILATLAAGLSGCGQQPTDEVVDLSALSTLPDHPSAVAPLRLAVSNVMSPRGTVESYGALLDYLSVKLDRPVELTQRRTYAETNELIRSGEVDVAFVCTSAYVAGHDEFGMELLAAPRVRGEVIYHSALIVRSDHPATSMVDLRGAVFAFTDPMSTTGYRYPTHLVQQLGETPENFFDRTFYTYSHDDAIQAVARGLADAAAVDQLVLAFASERDTGLAKRVRVIHRSPPFAMPPVVAGQNLPPQERVLLQEILLGLADDPAARQALTDLGIEAFALIDDTAYNSVRNLTRNAPSVAIGSKRP